MHKVKRGEQMFNKKGKIVKCPHCGSKRVEAHLAHAQAVTYICCNITCRKIFTKEYK